MKNKLDVLIMVDSGIGNAIQALYSLEYLLRLNVKAGIFLGGVNQSFQKYLRDCYGEAIIDGLNDVETIHLIHGFTYQEESFPDYQHYYYINADYHSSKQASETEQFLHLVQGLYSGGELKQELSHLKGVDNDKIRNIQPERKIILYPGGSALNSARRWPYFKALAEHLGDENAIIIGGKDDINFEMSYVYPNWVAKILPQAFLNRKGLWAFLKKLGILKKHSHWPELSGLPNAYIEEFKWPELVSLMRKAKGFFGNDGGLLHLAAAVGMQGFSYFGPTSATKNRPLSEKIKTFQSSLSCSPCQFGVGGVQMTKDYINCPYQVRCMRSFIVNDAKNNLGELEKLTS